MKRLFDVVLVLIAVLIVIIPLALLALFVRMTSKGPALYWSDRVGKNNQIFKMPKFRSMRTDAEKKGAQWARTKDDRVTRVGGFIRKCRIDELPQLVSVLKGEMSLVGPRPEVPRYVEHYPVDLKARALQMLGQIA